MQNYTSICTKHLLSTCLLIHMQFNFIVCFMHSSALLFQFTYLFIYFCCSWLSLNSFKSPFPCVLPVYSSALWFPSMNTFQPSSTWSFCNPTSVLKLWHIPLVVMPNLPLWDIPVPWNEVDQTLHHSTTTFLNQIILLLVIH